MSARTELSEKIRRYGDETVAFADDIGGLLVKPALYLIAAIIEYVPNFIEDQNSTIAEWLRRMSDSIDVANIFNSNALTDNFTSLPSKLGTQIEYGFQDGMDTWMFTSKNKRVIWSHKQFDNYRELWISIGEPKQQEELESKLDYLSSGNYYEPNSEIINFRMHTHQNTLSSILKLPSETKLRLIRQQKKGNGYVEDIDQSESVVQANPSTWLNMLKESLPLEITSQLEGFDEK